MIIKHTFMYTNHRIQIEPDSFDRDAIRCKIYIYLLYDRKENLTVTFKKLTVHLLLVIVLNHSAINNSDALYYHITWTSRHVHASNIYTSILSK